MFAGLKVEIFKPALDDRFAKDQIVSHSDLRIPSRAVKTAKDVLRFAHEAQVIGIDEGQFLGPDLVKVCERLARRGKRVIVAGLDQDYRGKPFEPMPQLLAIAEYITKTLAICVVCGNPANRSYRKKRRTGRVLVGGADLYEARCRRCFELGRRAVAPDEPPPPGGSDEVAPIRRRRRRTRRTHPRRGVRAKG